MLDGRSCNDSQVGSEASEFVLRCTTGQAVSRLPSEARPGRDDVWYSVVDVFVVSQARAGRGCRKMRCRKQDVAT